MRLKKRLIQYNEKNRKNLNFQENFYESIQVIQIVIDKLVQFFYNLFKTIKKYKFCCMSKYI